MFDITIQNGRDGWYLVDGYGEEHGGPYTEIADAKRQLAELERAHAENYEPPDPPGWEGGFAPNH
jgi:hypothetical protein